MQLYGACEETYRKVTNVRGAFDQVINNCKKIKSAGINLSLRSPIINETKDQMEAMKNIANRLEVPFVCTFEICPTIDKDRSPQSHQVDLKTILQYEFDNYINQIKNGERKDEKISDEVIRSLKNQYVFSCNVGINSFVVDYKGNMCPCMKLKHHGVKISSDTFDETWHQFSVYSKLKSSPKYKCSNCDSRYFCDICPAEMELMFGDFEFRDSHMCMLAHLRKSFYKKEKSYDNVFKEAANVYL